MGAASSDTKSYNSLSPNLWVPTWKGLWNGEIRSQLWDAGRTVKNKFKTSHQTDPPEEKVAERTLPQCISLFLPEFPVWSPAAQPELKILGCVAKGSLGPVLKVLNCTEQKIFALKVLPKGEVLRRNTLRQCKEEVSIQAPFNACEKIILVKVVTVPDFQNESPQNPLSLLSDFSYWKSDHTSPLGERQVKHPFIQCLGESWQGQRHLFIMCNYCSYGDLYSLWMSAKYINEDTIRLFAAELVSVLVYLHDLGIIHRDVKMENILLDERGHLKLSDFGLSRHLPFGERAYTICGTLQYMAPEVLSGGPYSHSVDWFSLGVLLFALTTGKFPVASTTEHVSMLERVNDATYDVPETVSQGLSHLLKELLCKIPRQRLRFHHQFKSHIFFRGITFDPTLLQKFPVDLVLKMRKSEVTIQSDLDGFEDFDWELTQTLQIPYPA